MGKTCVMSVAVFLLAACATPPAGQQWTQKGRTESRIAMDESECDTLTFFLWPFVWGKNCMKSRGYYLEDEAASK